MNGEESIIHKEKSNESFPTTNMSHKAKLFGFNSFKIGIFTVDFSPSKIASFLKNTEMKVQR